ncbi:unnamed protein product [Arabis nemorensis]|uniref:Arabidopsis retrotransposon Orf1 C-terminal domain-containing protein n=1 Tax=Arabis nemorensis TaxID=586526 RepID=A0A565BUR8_9BRAS|nr:unnamed protein product [Arabis nemorensis]
MVHKNIKLEDFDLNRREQDFKAPNLPSPIHNHAKPVSYLAAAADNEPGRVQFKIGRNHFSLSYTKFLDIYRIVGDAYRPSPVWNDADLVWHNIASDAPYHPSVCRISKVKNPTVRYALRLLGHTMFARPQPCLAKDEELRMVYGAIQRWLNNRYDRPIQRPWMRPEVGSWLLNQFFRVKHDALGSQDYQICIGGLLTPIFTACGID